MADKLDLKREQKEFYSAPTDRFVEVEVPQMLFLQIDGTGSPDSAGYARAVEALYALSYPVKFASKQAGRDYVVCPLEGLWWSERMELFTERAKDEWSWTMMIRQPDWITEDMVASAPRERRSPRRPPPRTCGWPTYTEGLSVQIMHLAASRARRRPSLACTTEYLPASGLVETATITRSTSPTRVDVRAEKLRT